MEFQTHYTRRKKDLDKGGGQVLVELAGYIPAQKRIENIMDAGHRLIESRTAESYYHFKTGEEYDLSFEDPTLNKGFDMADATQMALMAEANLRQAQADLEAAEALKKASESKLNEVPA